MSLSDAALFVAGISVGLYSAAWAPNSIGIAQELLSDLYSTFDDAFLQAVLGPALRQTYGSFLPRVGLKWLYCESSVVV
jgi:hypothetical protein